MTKSRKGSTNITPTVQRRDARGGWSGSSTAKSSIIFHVFVLQKALELSPSDCFFRIICTFLHRWTAPCTTTLADCSAKDLSNQRLGVCINPVADNYKKNNMGQNLPARGRGLHVLFSRTFPSKQKHEVERVPHMRPFLKI